MLCRMQCTVCKNWGHEGEVCPNKDEIKKRKAEGRLYCYFCEQNGHKHPDCPELRLWKMKTGGKQEMEHLLMLDIKNSTIPFWVAAPPDFSNFISCIEEAFSHCSPYAGVVLIRLKWQIDPPDLGGDWPKSEVVVQKPKFIKRRPGVYADYQRPTPSRVELFTSNATLAQLDKAGSFDISTSKNFLNSALSMMDEIATTSNCLEYMTECLLEDYSNTEVMFDLLLSPHMKVLDLSDGTGRDAERNLRIVRLAFDRCLQLTTLKIHDNPPLPVAFSEGQRNFEVEESFACILQRFEFLQILDLSFTIYGARSMLKLGSINQPKIRELLVDYCPGVTDTVVKVFCNGQSSLQILSVNGTEVTHSGIRFAIEHLPDLKELECDDESDIFKAFRRIRKET
ncbi:hypothetical protein DAPPUDRAFT_336533 [Daphnia pulex]|uniref:CCHC-type domain-containing protein n=1 Tax=Daphnia pulex TaxID=6669 RepID=E9HZV6_DAPPU|nr:hypothetical protein DAPPUDRAFT_336533 [Daphnia pulex]|eukprot:EFX62724.1 hypothetical protein DAPPUDRAFT_336533 [Daphnia pulex]